MKQDFNRADQGIWATKTQIFLKSGKTGVRPVSYIHQVYGTIGLAK
jgi:hypothetical protein